MTNTRKCTASNNKCLCRFDLCTRPTTAGYDFNGAVENLRLSPSPNNHFSVSKLKCAAGYEGNPVATTCTGDKQPYHVSGCTRIPGYCLAGEYWANNSNACLQCPMGKFNSLRNGCSSTSTSSIIKTPDFHKSRTYRMRWWVYICTTSENDLDHNVLFMSKTWCNKC